MKYKIILPLSSWQCEDTESLVINVKNRLRNLLRIRKKNKSVTKIKVPRELIDNRRQKNTSNVEVLGIQHK